MAFVFVLALFGWLLIGPFQMAVFPWSSVFFPSSGGQVVTAQTVSSPWNRTYGGGEADAGISVIEVSTGGFACIGYTKSSGAGAADVWLVRTAVDGTPQWTQTYGGTEDDHGHSIQEIAAGGFIILGSTESYGSGSKDWFLIRVSADGTFLLGHAYGGSDSDEATSVIEVSGGDLVLVGDIQNSDTKDHDVWLMRTDYLGYEIWNHTYGGVFNDFGRDVIEVNAGGFALVGFTQSYGAGDYDVYLIRTEANGNLLWSRTYGGSSFENSGALIEVSTGGFAIIGTTRSSGHGSNDMFLVRTDASGNMLWNKTYGGLDDEGGYSLIEVSTGGFALVGYSESFGAGDADFWVVRTDVDGNVLWNQTFGGVNYDLARSIVEVSTGGFVVTGTTSSFGGGYFDLWLLHVTTFNLILPISFELFVVLIGTLIAVITIASIVVYRRRTAII